MRTFNVPNPLCLTHLNSLGVGLRHLREHNHIFLTHLLLYGDNTLTDSTLPLNSVNINKTFQLYFNSVLKKINSTRRLINQKALISEFSLDF